MKVFKKTSTLCKSILLAEIFTVGIFLEIFARTPQNQISCFPYLTKLERNEAKSNTKYLGNQPMDFIEIFTQSKQKRFIGAGT